MAQQHFLANRETEMVLLALQVFQVLFLWVHGWIPLERPYPDWPYDWLVISYACFHRANPRLVDTLFLPTGTEASCSLSNHVRQNAFLLADAQWNGPKHRAYRASFGDRRDVDRSPHEVRTAISPRSKLPIGRHNRKLSLASMAGSVL